MSQDDTVYRVIANIPKCLSTVDIRNYFSYLVEKDAFNTFYYTYTSETNFMGEIVRTKAEVSKFMESKGFELSNSNPKKFVNLADHIFNSTDCSEDEEENEEENEECIDLINLLQEVKIVDSPSNDLLLESVNCRKNDLQSDLLTDEQAEQQSCSEDSLSESSYCVDDNIDETEERRFCCLITVKKEFDDNLKKLYHQKFWVDMNGNILPIRCLVFDFDPLQLVMDYIPAGNDSLMKNRTRDEIFEEAFHYTLERLCRKFHSLKIFCNENKSLSPGNVGSKNQNFEDIFDKYYLNMSLLNKFGIKFSVNSNVSRFCKLPFLHNSKKDGNVNNFPRVFTANGDVIPSHCDFRQINRREELNLHNDLSSRNGHHENELSVMDWHTFEEFLNVTREKERSCEFDFQEDIELLVANGNVGVVQYFDGQFWYQKEGGDKMRTLKGWNVRTKTNFNSNDMTFGRSVNLIKKWSKRHCDEVWPGNEKCRTRTGRYYQKFDPENAFASFFVENFLASIIMCDKTLQPVQNLVMPKHISENVWNKFFRGTWIELYGFQESKNDPSAEKPKAATTTTQRQELYEKTYESFAHDDCDKFPYYFGGYIPEKTLLTAYHPQYDLVKKKLDRRGLIPNLNRKPKYGCVTGQYNCTSLLGNYNPQNTCTSLLGNYNPQNTCGSRRRYDMLGYDKYGRSVFDNPIDEDHKFWKEDLSRRRENSKYGISPLLNEERFLNPSYLAAQRCNYSNYDRRFDYFDYNEPNYDNDDDHHLNEWYNYMREVDQRREYVEKEAPTAKYENDGNFTSGIKLLGPTSCCIIKASAKMDKRVNASEDSDSEEVVVEVSDEDKVEEKESILKEK